jgi:hypothetical protein
MYGPPPEYPRATSSPTIILLVSGMAAVLGFLIGFLMGYGSGESSAAPAPRVTVTVDEPAEPDPAQQDPTQQDPAQQGPTQQGPTQQGPTQQGPTQAGPTQAGTVTGGTTPGAGAPAPTATAPAGATPGGTTAPLGAPSVNRTLVVGVDIQPGTYRTSGPAAGQPMCYWARLKSTVPQTADIIAADMPQGAATVTIAPTDKAFQTGGCADWVKA